MAPATSPRLSVPPQTLTVQSCVHNINALMRLGTRMAREEREAGAVGRGNTRAEFRCPMNWLSEGTMALAKSNSTKRKEKKKKKKSNNYQTIFS